MLYAYNVWSFLSAINSVSIATAYSTKLFFWYERCCCLPSLLPPAAAASRLLLLRIVAGPDTA
jgi:hypothetical protein